MNVWQLWIVGGIYLYTGLKLGFVNQDWWWAMVWCGYAIAQVGLIMKMP